MKPSHTIDTYIDLFYGALKDSLAVWQWPITALAGLISSGIVIHGVIDAGFYLKPVESLNEALYALLTTQLTFLLMAVNALIAQSTATILVVVGLGIIATVLIIAIALFSMQFALSASNKSREATYKEIRKDISGVKSGRLFGIHALRRILMLLLVSLAVFPLSFLLGRDSALDLLIYLAFYAFVLPFAFVLQAIAMKASFIIMKTDQSVLESVRTATHRFKHHWLHTLEFNVFLYALLLSLFGVGYYLFSAGNLILSVGLEFIKLYTSSGVTTFITVAVYTGVFLGAWLLAGFSVTFVYNAWERFLQSLEQSPFRTFAEHVIRFIRQ